MAHGPAPPTSLSPYARRRYRPPQTPGVPGGSEDAFVYLQPLGLAAIVEREEETILSLARAMEYRDWETGGRIERMGHHALRTGSDPDSA